MLSFVGTLLLAAAAPAQTVPDPAPDPCAGDPNCRRASAAELFAAADALAGEGDLAGAETILEALTADPSPELRAEARFRLASIRERLGNLLGAIEALRTLLDEQPNARRARLELSRILAATGDAEAARRELRRASAGGLPREVARTVRRFSSALNSLKRRGASVELALAGDSNINRSTSDRFLDTVIAPFQLDPDARETSGTGASLSGEAWSRDELLGTPFLSRAGVHADLFFGKERFNDVQIGLSSGPELTTRIGRIRPALTLERRWYGRRTYSGGYGGSFSWILTPNEKSQLQFEASIVRQSIRRNTVLDGHRYSASIAYDRAFTPETSARFTLRAAALDAAVRPESLRQVGTDALVAHMFSRATVFVQAGYARTEGRAPLALFGKMRKDDRFDLGAGLIAQDHRVAGFAPLVRLIYTSSRSNIDLYDYRRARAEVGVSREF